MKKFLFTCFCCFLVLFSGAQEQQTYKKVEYPAGYTEQLNVVYTAVDGWDGKMDLYLPPKDKGASPVVINIHGGGWARGSKESQTGFNTFFKRGYAVANIAYRLSPQATAPAAVEDTRCALIYLIKNAKALNIDVNKIVIMGSSAGGHLALLGGLIADNPIFDKNCRAGETVKVAAIINKYGVADLSETAPGAQNNRTAAFWLGDKVKDLAFRRSVSPIYYLKKDSPPIFSVHGDADPTVPYQQSVELHKKLNKLGVKNEFITVEGGLHGKFPKEKNAEINERIIAFLSELGL